MTELKTGIYLTDMVNGKAIQVSIEDCPERVLCRWIWKLDNKAIDWLIDSLAKSIKKFRKIIGQPKLGEDFISDASKKSTLAGSTKDFLAESMCVGIKQWKGNTES